MEVTINAGLLAVRDMNIDTCHRNKQTKDLPGKVRVFLSGLLVLLPFLLIGQSKSKALKIIAMDDSAFFAKHIAYTHTYNSNAEKDKILDNVLLDLYDKAYLSANYESIKSDTNQCLAILKIGKPYLWAKLSRGNIDEGWLSMLGYRQKLYSNTKFNYKQVKTLLEKVLSYAENSGYPFAQARLKDVKVSDSHIEAGLYLVKGKRIIWDTIEVIGDKDTAISRDYLRTYLGIFPGKPYNEKSARQIRIRLREVLYIRMVEDPQIIFKGNKAKVRLFIEEQKANRLDGILGLAPNSAVNNKFLLTGELNLGLQNLMGEGIPLTLGYKSFLKGGQQINVGTQYPYFLKLPIAITEDFNLMKADTSYYIIDNQLGINYFLSGKNYFRFFYNSYTTHLLDAQVYSKSHSLPPFLDVSTDWYGLGLHLEDLDYKYNPRQGYSLHIEASAGVKNVARNPILDESLYDSIHLHKVIYRFKGDASLFIPIATHSTINLGIQAALLTDNELSKNQLFRIGGLHDLRGFDEQSINASSYYIPRIEYRYLIDKGSNFQIFYNAAYYQKYERNIRKQDIPMGAGLGYNYLTKAGLFSISFAVGKQLDNPFDFNATKLHIGYLNRF